MPFLSFEKEFHVSAVTCCIPVAPLGLSKAGAQYALYKKWWAVPTLQMYKVELRRYV